MKKRVAVLIVDYKSHLNDFEYTSIDRCFDVLRNRDIYVMLPDGVSNMEYEYIAKQYGVKINYIYEKNGHLNSWNDYCHYCFNPEFYERFIDYEYLMIYQTDCYIFEDNLDYFMDMGYNYYGAPWFQFRKCGNGGFCLRKVEAFLENVNTRPDRDELINGKFELIEDYVFSICENHIENICPESVGLEFSLDGWLEQYDSIITKRPMGCHGWTHDEFYWYWKDKIEVKKNPINAKLLILCMSCNQEKFLKEEELVKQTWGKDIDNAKYIGINYTFFRGGSFLHYDEKSNVIFTDTKDDFNSTAIKTVSALEYASKVFDYDFVIITNMSTYFNLKLLYKFINSRYIQSNKIYGGDLIFPLTVPPFIRGNFLFLPKNLVDRVVEDRKMYHMWNDVHICASLINYFNDHKSFLKSLRCVEAIRELKYFDIKALKNCFYVSLKSFGEEKNYEHNMFMLYNIFENIEDSDDLKDLVGNFKQVTTVNGVYKIERVNE